MYETLLSLGIPLYLAVIPLIIITNDVMGRRMSLALISVLSALLFVILDICMPKAAAIAVLFVARALSSGMFSIVYLYTNEVSATSYWEACIFPSLCMVDLNIFTRTIFASMGLKIKGIFVTHLGS